MQGASVLSVLYICVVVCVLCICMCVVCVCVLRICVYVCACTVYLCECVMHVLCTCVTCAHVVSACVCCVCDADNQENWRVNVASLMRSLAPRTHSPCPSHHSHAL